MPHAKLLLLKSNFSVTSEDEGAMNCVFILDNYTPKFLQVLSKNGGRVEVGQFTLSTRRPTTSC